MERIGDNLWCKMVLPLPEEVWVHIFEYLDYKSLQCISVLVCKEWFTIIRNDCKLSGELKIKQFKHEDLPDIKGVLISESFSPRSFPQIDFQNHYNQN